MFACLNKHKQNNSYFVGLDSSNFIKEMDTTSSYYKYAKKWEYKLNLASLEKGHKGFEMRFWYNPELVLLKRLIAIKYLGEEWSVKAYNVRTSIDEETGDIAVDSSVDLIPKSGWIAFQNKLSELQVRQLPHYSFMQGDKLIDDGITYFAEVANQNSYRLTWFSNPQANVKSNKSARQWQAVVNLFSQEFDVSK
jgi:hypothetical protein